MKKIFFLSGILTVILFLSGCTDSEDLLDKAETGDLKADMIYQDIVLADQVLNDLYGRLPNILIDQQNDQGRFTASTMLDAATVYGAVHMNWSNANIFNSGGWGASNNPLDVKFFGNANIFRRNYESIRACLLFLDNIEKVPFDPEYGYGSDELQIKIGEAKFLLAFFYSELIRFYGGVPLIKEVLDLSSEQMKKPRDSYDECIDYVSELCDEAAAILPANHSASNYGRATRGAALALKARMLLTAASPLFNDPSKTEATPFNGAYSENKWELAAQTAGEVIKSGTYELMPDINNIFITKSNSEVIFARQQPAARWAGKNAYPPNIDGGGNVGRNQATYNNMANYKVLKDGQAYDQEDPLSGWDIQNPYKNLDPRFYRDFCFNGGNTRNKLVKMWALGEGTSPADKAPHTTTNQCSYLIVIKYADQSINTNIVSQRTEHNFPFLRYAEVLLSYAEAMNEAYGPESDALGVGLSAREAVNLIRRRTTYPATKPYLGYTGGMPDLPENLSKEDFRKEVRQERMVELNFEESQFFDLRRWKLPVESQTIARLLVPTRIVNELGQKIIEYRMQEIPRAFDAAWYLMPIPEDQLLLNPAYEQNPGW